ncbi:MAG: MBL fold metallo-hydrolase [Planctomycetia bacterium]|nr:MBL fold metallo-hydrolase [Planctomycetia bacterium]
MKKQVVWLGHNCWQLSLGTTHFLIDPYLSAPDAPCSAEDISCHYILISHGHADHCADALTIARRTGATVIAMAEVADWFAKRGAKNVEPMNIGGMVPARILSDAMGPASTNGVVLMTPALHSSTMPDGSPGGNSCGFLLAVRPDGNNIDVEPESEVQPLRAMFADAFVAYFACDTGYFSEMSLLGLLGIDAAFLPIGGRYTMGPSASLTAIDALKPRHVFPSHYGTWPPIEQKVNLWADAVRKYTTAIPQVVTPGDVFTLG